MKSLYESIMQSRFPINKIEESILSKSGVGLEVKIDEWCKKYGIKKYTINNKGEIDSNIGINISHKDIKEHLFLYGSARSKNTFIVIHVALHH